MTWGCVNDETRFAGRVENRCLDDGSWYVDACGPRTSMLFDGQWALTYTKHRDFNTGRCQEYAGKFEQLARDSGGGANGFAAQRIADAWFKRDITAGGVGGPDQAAPFFRRICDQMRVEYPDGDVGPGSTSEAEGSMKYLVGNFLYRECKYMDGFDLCSNPFAMNIVDGWTEIKYCLYDGPACRRERDVCLGNCGGNVSKVKQDFHTFAAKVELSQRVLGTEVLAQGRANCSIRSTTFNIPLFDGMGDEFVAYASRLRIRGGFLAINPKACQRDPEACAAVQRVLERDPTLTFVNGRFVHVHELKPPLPPPPPATPPLLDIYSRPAPVPFPPAPSPPPPWHQHAETCVPITTAAENNIEVDEGLERAVCVYVRAIADERVRATKCFDQMPPSPPPPPPVPRSRLANMMSKFVKIREESGQSAGPYAVPDDTNEEAYQKEHEAQTAAQVALLDSLASENTQLRDLLGNVRNRIFHNGGRRLWERSSGRESHELVENVLATEAFGNAPLTDVTIAECQALCHALADNTNLGTCQGIAFARATANPRDTMLRQCYLLKSLGGCSASSFAAAVFLRRDTDSCTDPSEEDNPLCVQLSNTRDTRVLDYADATTACRQGRGRPELAWPKTALEAFSMLGYARERGVSSFWSNKPNEGGTMPWSGLDGLPLVVPPGDKRCVLVTTVDTSIHGFMYAELKPCGAKLADGVVCESAMAYRKFAPLQHFYLALCHPRLRTVF
jgi:hypothetical protein